MYTEQQIQQMINELQAQLTSELVTITASHIVVIEDYQSQQKQMKTVTTLVQAFERQLRAENK